LTTGLGCHHSGSSNKIGSNMSCLDNRFNCLNRHLITAAIRLSNNDRCEIRQGKASERNKAKVSPNVRQLAKRNVNKWVLPVVDVAPKVFAKCSSIRIGLLSSSNTMLVLLIVRLPIRASSSISNHLNHSNPLFEASRS